MNLINVEIDDVLRSISSTSQGIQRGVGSSSDESVVDINHLFDVLYSLIKSGGFLLNEGEVNPGDEIRKFLLTEEYPDIPLPDVEVVSMELERRDPASLGANKKPYDGTKHYRPMLIKQDKDIDGVVLHMANIYDNTVTITCWSGKTSRTRKLASLVESLMQKYYWAIRKEGFPTFIYQGRGKRIVSDDTGESRTFGIPLTFFVRTVELFTLKENEFKNIGIETFVSQSCV